MILKKIGQQYTFLVRLLAGGELDGRCDGCVRRHSLVNASCSMNQKQGRVYADCFYNFRTRQPIKGVWRQVEATFQKGTVGIEVWERIRDVAPTTTQGQIL